MMKMTTLTILGVVLMTLVGCADPADRTGEVIRTAESTGRVGALAPTVSVRTLEGKETTLAKMAGPIRIVAFADYPAKDCCWLSPKVVSLAREVSLESVAVVQMGRGCPQCKGCFEKTRLPKENLIGLCDSSDTGWEAFGRPKNKTTFLVDSAGQIVLVGSVDAPRPLIEKARELAAEWDKRQAESAEGS